MTPHRLDCLATCDIEEAARFYESRRPGLGPEFRKAIAETLLRIVAAPALHRVIRSGVRRCLVRKFPYAVLYHFDGETVLVVVITHLQRKPDWWRQRVATLLPDET